MPDSASRPVVITSMPSRFRRHRPLIIALVVALVLAVAAGGAFAWAGWKQRQDEEALTAAASALARDWAAGKLGEVAWAPGEQGSAPVVPAEAAAAITAGLTAGNTDLPAAVRVTSVRRTSDTAATADAVLSLTWNLDGATWAYDTTVHLVRPGAAWQVLWSPALIQPSLAQGEVLRTDRTPGKRADILGADGAAIVTARPVVLLGFEPSEASNRQATARALAKVVGVDPDKLASRAAAVKNTSVIDVVTLREPAYEALRPRLAGLDGVVTTPGERPLAPTSGFARVLLGSAGPATAEIVEQSKGRVRAGDLTGLSGLQRTYDARLAGTAGVQVRAEPAADAAEVDSGTDAQTGSARTSGEATGTPTARTLFESPAKNGTPVRLTLDVATQQAAETALSKATKPAGLVAIKASTGQVLAVANGGPNAAGFDRALAGQFPPGSTFKIVSTYGLLAGGLAPSQTVPCPKAATVQGKSFGNYEDEEFGSQPFHRDFALSCNTAFVGLASRLSQSDLVAAAKALGVGAEPALGTAAFTGGIPATDDAVEHAADMIGQGKVLANPLTMATVSAAVAGGTAHRPALVVDPAPDGAGAALPALDPAGVKTLRALMREVVTSGTGKVLAPVPGGPVSAKTGTAEYGSARPPRTHAWITGFQGDVAFAVVVEDGGTGGKVAGPLAADFLARLTAG